MKTAINLALHTMIRLHVYLAKRSTTGERAWAHQRIANRYIEMLQG